MKLTIEDVRGVWKAELNNRAEFADTLEDLFLKLAPDAPLTHLWNTAEVLGSLLGAQAVEVDYSGLAAMFLDTIYEEQWNPTPEQQAYFEPERTEEVESFNPDTQPRGV